MAVSYDLVLLRSCIFSQKVVAKNRVSFDILQSRPYLSSFSYDSSIVLLLWTCGKEIPGVVVELAVYPRKFHQPISECTPITVALTALLHVGDPAANY
jgi:hypothetical protein